MNHSWGRFPACWIPSLRSPLADFAVASLESCDMSDFQGLRYTVGRDLSADDIVPLKSRKGLAQAIFDFALAVWRKDLFPV